MSKHDDESETQSTEDFFAEVERRHAAPWPKRLWYFRAYWLSLPWTTMKDAYWWLRAFVQRGRRGWADSDTWNFSSYLARITAEMLAYGAEHTYGVPAGYQLEGDILEESSEALHQRGDAWIAFQRELAQAFRDYVAFMESDESREDVGNARYRELLARMQPLLGEWYAFLGD